MPPESGSLPASDLTADEEKQENYYWTPSTPSSTAIGRSAARRPHLPYLGGLDGLRALAVIAVVVYHYTLDRLPGGFLGVEIFFVLSGYLITSLLLAEWRQRGRIDLKAFWLRRARRLLPALFFLLLVSLTFAVLFLPDEVARMRRDAVAAFFYVTNWYLIYHHESYFQAVGRPPILQHLWSLAVEEQFYVVWPLLFTGLMLLWRRRRVFYAVAAGALLSSVWMAILYQPALDPTRLYFGTDTRAAELLVGAALALIWEPGRLTSRNGLLSAPVINWLNRTDFAPYLLDGLGMAGLLGLLAFCRFLGEYDPLLYRGGFAAVALTTALVIAVLAHPRARLVPRLLGSGPLRYIGTRSYSIYLWHWPIFMVTRPQLDIELTGVPLFALRIGATLVMSEISYRFVETPIRHGALGRAWHSLHDADDPQRTRLRALWAGAGGTAVTLMVVLGVAVAGAKEPPPPAYLAVSAVHTHGLPPVGVAGTPQVTPLPVVTPPPTPDPTATPSPTPTPTAPAEQADVPPAGATGTPTATATATPSPTPTPTPSPTPVPSVPVRVTAVGDSVMIGAAEALQRDIDNISIDAVQGLQVADAIDIMRARKAAGQLGDIVVVHLGDNGVFTSEEFDEMMGVLADARKVIFVNVKVPRSWEGPNNDVIVAGVQRYPNTTLVDWRGVSLNHPDYFWDDGIHLRPTGAEIYANLIAAHVANAEQNLEAGSN